MARVLGYGGLANTNGARSFAGKAEAEELFGNRRQRMLSHLAQAPWWLLIIVRIVWDG